MRLRNSSNLIFVSLLCVAEPGRREEVEDLSYGRCTCCCRAMTGAPLCSDDRYALHRS